MPLAYLYRTLGFVDRRAAREVLLSVPADGGPGARVLAIGTLGECWTKNADIDARPQARLKERDPAVTAAVICAIDERRRSRAASPREAASRRGVLQ